MARPRHRRAVCKRDRDHGRRPMRRERRVSLVRVRGSGLQEAARVEGRSAAPGFGLRAARPDRRPPVRIVSLLPSATESLFALGLGGSVVAVTHECDYPPEASSLPIVTRSTLGLHDKDSAGIEIAVSEAALAARPSPAVGVSPPPRAPRPRAGGSVAAPRWPAPLPRRRVLVSGGRPPPYPAGHWTPDLLALAGIDDQLSRPGAPSIAISWADVAAARPELLVLAPCGFNQQRAQAEADPVRWDIQSGGAEHVVVLDWAAYFNRP